MGPSVMFSARHPIFSFDDKETKGPTLSSHEVAIENDPVVRNYRLRGPKNPLHGNRYELKLTLVERSKIDTAREHPANVNR